MCLLLHLSSVELLTEWHLVACLKLSSARCHSSAGRTHLNILLVAEVRETCGLRRRGYDLRLLNLSVVLTLLCEKVLLIILVVLQKRGTY